MSPISFIGGLGEVVGSWCFYLGVLLCVPIAMWLHELGTPCGFCLFPFQLMLSDLAEADYAFSTLNCRI